MLLYREYLPLKPKKKKKWRFRLLIVIFIFLNIVFLFGSTMSVYAQNGSLQEIEKELGQNVDKNINDLNLSELEAFVRSLENNQAIGTSITEFIKKVIKGESGVSFTDYFKMSISEMGKQIFDFVPLLALIMGIAILFSIIDGMSSGFVNKSTREIIYFVCYAAIIVIVITKVTGLVKLTTDTVGSMSKLMDIAFPILLTMITALGGVVCVTTYQPMMAVVSTVIVGLINSLIIPCFIATMVLSVVGNLTKNIKLEKLTKFFKTSGEVILSVVFSLFITFITLQGITGAISDNISMKSAKFAISSYVPILGGYLSEGFDLVMASVVLIKNALGLSGVLIMLSIVLMPIIKILVFTLGLKLIAGLIEPIGDKRMSELIYGISKNMVLLIISIIGVAFMFFIMVMLVIYTCNMGVV